MNKKFTITFIILMIFTIILSNGAFAAIVEVKEEFASNDMMTVLCNILNFVTGTMGKTVASFIIIGVGVGFFTAKVTWGVLIGVVLGVASMFGAPAIIGAMTGGGAICEGTK